MKDNEDELTQEEVDEFIKASMRIRLPGKGLLVQVESDKEPVTQRVIREILDSIREQQNKLVPGLGILTQLEPLEIKPLTYKMLDELFTAHNNKSLNDEG